MMTLDALKALLESGDVSEMENQRTGLQDFSKGAMNAMQGVQRGRGGNLGRALYGIAGGLGSYKGLNMSPGITAGKNQQYAALLRAIMGAQQPRQPNVRDMDTEQYGGPPGVSGL